MSNKGELTKMKSNILKYGMLLLGLLIGVEGGISLAGDAAFDNLIIGNKTTLYGPVSIQKSGQGTIPLNGLVLYYNFNSAASPVPDQSGLGRVGTISGATWVPNGIAGGAYSFNGTSSYINAGRIPELEGAVNYTVSLWVKAGNCSGTRFYFTYDCDDNAGNNASSRDAYFIWANAISKLDFGAATGSEIYYPATVNMADSAWHHLVLVRAANTVSVYANGILQASAVVTYSVTGGSTYKLRLGHPMNASAFDGLMDEFMVYNRALSSDEVAALYFASAPVVAGGGTLSTTDGISQSSSQAANIFMGKVGVGIAIPTAKLHVVGDAKVEGALTVNGKQVATEEFVTTHQGTVVPAGNDLSMGDFIVGAP